MNRKLILFAALLLGAAASAGAQPRAQAGGQQRPELFEALIHCRALAEDAARLRCFDAAASALEQAAARRDVVVVDRAQVRETRRRLFGLALPRLPIFGSGDGVREEEEEVSSLEGVISSAEQNDLGQWYIRLREGGLWVQTDHNLLALQPRAGQSVVINRGVMGAYMMRVARQPGIRVRRQN
ncbi:MAG: hypothetical protein QOG13_2497 [Sphingomonadales bacterium]|jgi:hypothetical protein|nr:hypothetical protein [Sphingomonadales bacterium]MEA3042752.1 hypothetical protein [Sphingomonadales bacterium]